MVKDLRRPGRPKSLICKDLGLSLKNFVNRLTNAHKSPMLYYMNNRERLEQILDLETPLAEAGCLTAQSLVINAQAELDELDMLELAMRRNQEGER